MRCEGKFLDDRICDICEITDRKTYDKCVKIKTETIEMNEKLRKIQDSCPYRIERCDDYTWYYACNKDGRGYIRDAKDCEVTLECENCFKI